MTNEEELILLKDIKERSKSLVREIKKDMLKYANEEVITSKEELKNKLLILNMAQKIDYKIDLHDDYIKPDQKKENKCCYSESYKDGVCKCYWCTV